MTSTKTVYGSVSISSSPINGFGLELTASLPEILFAGQNLSVVAEVENTTPNVVNLTSTSMVNHANGPCAQGQVTAIDVNSGNYSYIQLFNNPSQPAPLLPYNPSLNYLCPAVFNFNCVFQPNSSTATVRAYLGGNQAMKDQVKVVEETSLVSGYWTQSGSAYVFHHFSSGTYAVVFYDYWGNTIIGYMQVFWPVAPKSQSPPRKRPILIVAVIAIVVVSAVSVMGYYSVKLSSCSGYPPGGNCVAPYNYTFMIAVNYTGRWSLNYTGQANVGEANPYNVTGTRGGTG